MCVGKSLAFVCVNWSKLRQQNGQHVRIWPHRLSDSHVAVTTGDDRDDKAQ